MNILIIVGNMSKICLHIEHIQLYSWYMKWCAFRNQDGFINLIRCCWSHSTWRRG